MTNGKPAPMKFADMTPRQKTLFVLKIAVCIISAAISLLPCGTPTSSSIRMHFWRTSGLLGFSVTVRVFP